jgi:hypothetical protein
MLACMYKAKRILNYLIDEYVDPEDDETATERKNQLLNQPSVVS